MQKDTSKDIGEFVVFRAIGQDFAIDILSVREIRGWSRPASLPRAPGHVRGVINLRGAIIPIVDFAMRLGLAETAEDDRNVIIVTALNGRVTGLLVETVTDILGLPMADIQPPPDLVPDATRAMLRGIVPLDGRLIRILEVATLLAPDLDGIAA